MLSKIFTISGLAMLASAHLKMSNPVPYNKASLDNSPLLPDGSNFPCKVTDGVYDADGASNVYKQGSTQKLAFIGSAVHGGGSCQVSVTTDLEPNKNSVWKVIKSIEGGCPAKNQVGNLPENANGVDPYQYDFTIPDELASGNYTLAWTWFNKVGNREMYMNCAPMTVTGSGGSQDFMSGLPDMFEANIFGPSGCGTPADTDLQFPNPGKDVDKFNGATNAFAAPTGSCKGGNSGPAPTTAPEPTSAPAAEPSQGPASDPSVPGGVFITKAPGGDQPSATQPAASAPAPTGPVAAEPAPTEPAATQPAPTEAPAPTGSAPEPSSGSGTGGYAAGSACTSEGQWNCIGGTQFQRCASGQWSTVQALAGGTTCSAGQAANLNMVVKRGRRSMRRALRMAA